MYISRLADAVVNVGVSCTDTTHAHGGATSTDTYSCSLSAAGRRAIAQCTSTRRWRCRARAPLEEVDAVDNGGGVPHDSSTRDVVEVVRHEGGVRQCEAVLCAWLRCCWRCVHMRRGQRGIE